jgi:hypothetical protein
LDPVCTVAGRVALEPGREQLRDPAPERAGVDVPLGAPQLAAVAHGAIADDAIAAAHDPRMLLEVDV